jgi:hypothetical protein
MSRLERYSNRQDDERWMLSPKIHAATKVIAEHARLDGLSLGASAGAFAFVALVAAIAAFLGANALFF